MVSYPFNDENFYIKKYSTYFAGIDECGLEWDEEAESFVYAYGSSGYELDYGWDYDDFYLDYSYIPDAYATYGEDSLPQCGCCYYCGCSCEGVGSPANRCPTE